MAQAGNHDDSRPVCALLVARCGIFTTAAATAATTAPCCQFLALLGREYGVHVLTDLVVDGLDLRLLVVGQIESAHCHPTATGTFRASASRTSASKALSLALALALALADAGPAHCPLSLLALFDARTLIGRPLLSGLRLHRRGADQSECGESNECVCACHGDLH